MEADRERRRVLLETQERVCMCVMERVREVTRERERERERERDRKRLDGD